jgi:hypothetical protein
MLWPGGARSSYNITPSGIWTGLVDEAKQPTPKASQDFDLFKLFLRSTIRRPDKRPGRRREADDSKSGKPSIGGEMCRCGRLAMSRRNGTKTDLDTSLLSPIREASG